MNNGILTCNDSPNAFLKKCKENITNCDSLQIRNIAQTTRFNPLELKTINNGLKLANYILQKNVIDAPINIPIKWIGGSTQSGNPYDVIVNNIPFSLKEKSSILENMGLYKLLNTLLDTSAYVRGIHIFEEYAKDSLNNWFTITRDLIIKELEVESFSIDILSKITKLSYSKSSDNLYFFFKGEELNLKGFSKYSYNDFIKDTTSIFREKVFSKCIKERISKDDAYNRSKKECSTIAGENFIEFINDRIDKTIPNESLINLFRIRDENYYYAKTTDTSIEVFKIPTKQEFSANIEISEIKSSVPISQLNILTKIKNIKTSEEFIFRNELRYTHGQFNGTPEAKLYTDKGSLEIAYTKI